MAIHKPVLLKEIIDYLKPKPNQNFIDCTIGGGGQAFKILSMTGPKGKLLGIDLSEEAIDELNKIKNKDKKIKNRLILVNDNFANLKKIVEKYNFKNVSGILLDLGLSTDLLKSGKGFSFQQDEFLDMRYGKDGITAYEIINQYPKESLEKILREFGEEKLAKPIVKNILEKRHFKKIRTTKELVEVVNEVLKKFKIYNFKSKVKTLARVFQALRIAVNDELENLKKVLPQTLEILESGGKIMVISYHSLEDRIVKNFFKEKKGILKIITKKPIRPTQEEIKSNPSSRSAKLRIAIKK
ncbi:MAG: 16S rRNA (cytosine(1402)-N(4))-methyltransferase RsmH [Patescibacteria group bacterium]